MENCSQIKRLKETKATIPKGYSSLAYPDFLTQPLWENYLLTNKNKNIVPYRELPISNLGASRHNNKGIIIKQ